MTPDFMAIYRERYQRVLVPVAERLMVLLEGYLEGAARIDRIAARAKDPARFAAKAAKRDGTKVRYDEPLTQIQDQVAARVVVFYKSDLEPTEQLLRRYFRPIEVRTVVPDSEWEFGYFGRHLVMTLPKDVVPPDASLEDAPSFFELQVKTLFQHAWSEAEHDLGYKPPEALSTDQKRLLAYTSAQAWGADDIFQRLAAELLS